MKIFARIFSAIAALAVFIFAVYLLSTPSTIHFVNLYHDEILRYINDNEESYHALIDYTFYPQIESFGSMVSFDNGTEHKMSTYFITKTTDKTEEGFVYVHDDSNGIPLQWGNYSLNAAERSRATYTIKNDPLTIKIIPIRDNLYYYHITWSTQRPTNNGG